ncbi:hypothetical protein bcgnr5369_16110 [Bacillus cereus]
MLAIELVVSKIYPEAPNIAKKLNTTVGFNTEPGLISPPIACSRSPNSMYRSDNEPQMIRAYK